MIVTTTPGIDGRRISAYHGVVTGETIIGANIFRDLFAGIRDIVGGRSGAYESALASARAVAIGALTYKSIASILSLGLDRTAPSAEAAPVLLHPNLRGPRYFH